MKCSIAHVLAVAAASAFATIAVAATTAAGPYYATPSWDQSLPSSTRFIVLSNMDSAAVLDRETGLVWTRSPSGLQTWASASSLCVDNKTGGRAGWRLPTVNEMASLFDTSGTLDPPLPPGHPFTAVRQQIALYWTLTPFLNFPGHWAFGYTVLSGATIPILTSQGSSDSSLSEVWCVRGGSVSGPQ